MIDTRRIAQLGWAWATVGWLSSAFNAHRSGQERAGDLICAAWALIAVALIAARRSAEGRE